MMNRCATLTALTGALLLSACNAPGGGNSNTMAAAPAETDLRGARIGGPFTLTDQDGKARSWAEFSGQYRIVYFGYTYCPDVCPLDLQRVAQGLKLFEKKAPERAAKVQPIFISVDPERDTPETIKIYVAAFHPRLIGLTGTPDQIAAVAKQFVTVYTKERPKSAGVYIVNHTRTPGLFAPDGAPLIMLPVDDIRTSQAEGTPQEIADALDRWVK